MIYFGWAPLWSKSGFIVPLRPDLSAFTGQRFRAVRPGDEDSTTRSMPSRLPSVTLRSSTTSTCSRKPVGMLRPRPGKIRSGAQDCTKTDANATSPRPGYYLGWGDDGWNWFRPLVQAYGGQAFRRRRRTTLWNQGGAVDA